MCSLVCRLISLTETISNKYLGGSYTSYEEDEGEVNRFNVILEFEPWKEEWKEVAKMFKTRYRHAVSVINFIEVEEFCNWGEYEDSWVVCAEVKIIFLCKCGICVDMIDSYQTSCLDIIPSLQHRNMCCVRLRPG